MIGPPLAKEYERNIWEAKGDATRQVPTVGAHCWKRGPRRDGCPGGPNYTKGRMLQNGNNRIISLLPYQGYIVTQRQIIECNVHEPTSKGTTIKELTLQLNNNLHVTWSFLEDSLLGNDGMQRLSPDLVAQVAAAFGLLCSHTNAMTTQTGSWKGTIKECTPNTVHYQDVLHCREPIYNNGRSNSKKSIIHFYILDPLLPELSSNILLETSRNFQNLPDNSRLFRTIPDSSPTQRSSPIGLIGTCVGVV